jgi:hypothetical protein
MSEFSKESAFGKNAAWQDDQRARESREADAKIAVQYVGRPNIVEVPKRELEDIIHNLRNLTLALDIEDAQLESDIEDAANRLASFLPG